MSMRSLKYRVQSTVQVDVRSLVLIITCCQLWAINYIDDHVIIKPCFWAHNQQNMCTQWSVLYRSLTLQDIPCSCSPHALQPVSSDYHFVHVTYFFLFTRICISKLIRGTNDYWIPRGDIGLCLCVCMCADVQWQSERSELSCPQSSPGLLFKPQLFTYRYI